MKFNKIAGLALAAVTAFSAVSASAMPIPAAKNNSEAYTAAEAFYHDGFYYEAKQALEQVNPSEIYYDANKQNEWMEAVNKKIAELEYNNQRAAIKALLAEVKYLNSKYMFGEALALLYTAENYTQLEYYSLKWWEEALLKNLGSSLNDAVKSGFQAVAAVKATGYAINSVYEVFSPVKVEDGYHVYVKTRTPNGKWENVAAFRVDAKSGTVVRVF